MLENLLAFWPTRWGALENLRWFVPALVVVAFLGVVLWSNLAKKEARQTTDDSEMLKALAPSAFGRFVRYTPWFIGVVAFGLLVVPFVLEPQRVTQEPFEQATLLNMVDASNTARAVSKDDPDSIPRIERQFQSLEDVLELTPERMLVGLSTFDTNVRVVVPPTTDREAIREAMGSVEIGMQTDIPNALIEMARYASHIPADDEGEIPVRIILFSDGKIDVQNPEVALDEAIKFVNDVGVSVYTVVFGEEGEITFTSDGQPESAGFDVEVMDRIAHETGGKPLVSSDAATVTSFIEEIGSSMGQRDITVPAFELFLLLAAIALVFSALVFTTTRSKLNSASHPETDEVLSDEPVRDRLAANSAL